MPHPGECAFPSPTLPLLPVTAWPRVVEAGPSVPTPMAGALYILPPERVHPVDMPFTVALKVFSKWGAGAGDFVRAMQTPKPSQAVSSPV